MLRRWRRSRARCNSADQTRDPLGWVKLGGRSDHKVDNEGSASLSVFEGLTRWHARGYAEPGGQMGVPACTLTLIGLPTSQGWLNVITLSWSEGTEWRAVPFQKSCDESLGQVDRHSKYLPCGEALSRRRKKLLFNEGFRAC